MDLPADCLPSLPDETKTALLRTIFSRSAEGLAFLDREGRILFGNDRFAKALGLQPEMMTGRVLSEIVPGGAELLGQTAGDSCCARTGDLLRAHPLPGPTGDPQGWLVVAMDAARGDEPPAAASGMVREAAAAALTREEPAESHLALLDTLLNAIPDPVAIYDCAGRVVRANPAAASFGLRAPSPGSPASALHLIGADGAPIAGPMQPANRALRGERVAGEVFRLRNAAGEDCTVRVSAAPIELHGIPAGALVVIQDITETERIQSENESQREFLRLLIEKAPVGIAVFRGPERRLELANPHYRGIPPAAPVSADEDPAGQAQLSAVASRLLDLVQRTGESVKEIESMVLDRDRNKTFWNVDLVPLPGNAGPNSDGVLLLAVEVTEQVLLRQRSEELNRELTEANELLAAILEQLPVGVVLCNQHGAIVLANREARKIYENPHPEGLTLAEQAKTLNLHRPGGGICPPEELPVSLALREGITLDNVELDIQRSDGLHTLLCTTCPLRAGDGRITGAVSAFRDVTLLQELARERERRLNVMNRLILLAAEVLAETTIEGLLQRVVDAARELTGARRGTAGYGSAEGDFPFFARSWAEDAQPCPTDKAVRTSLLRLIGDRNTIRLSGNELRALPACRDWNQKCAFCHALLGARLSGRAGETVGLIMVSDKAHGEFTAEDEALLAQLAALAALGLHHIEARREIERQVTLFRAVLQNMGDGLIVLSADGRVVLRNEMADRLGLLARASAEAADLNLSGLDGRPLPAGHSPAAMLLQGKQLNEREFLVIDPDGGKRRVLISGTAVKDEEDQVALAIITCSDVTALRELEQVQLDYLRIISHELRQPLTVIMAQAQLLDRLADKPERIRKNAQAITTCAWRMNSMIQDLVDSARMESGQLRLRRRAVDLRAMTLELLERIKTSVNVDRIRISAPDDLPPVQADEERLERVMVNLITNALKYSAPEAQVRIAFEPRGAEVVTTVSDRGRGIAPEDLPHIFERYYRAPAVRDLEEGLGLGLYITKGLIEAHGGRIWVESEADRGTSFHFTLPTA